MLRDKCDFSTGLSLFARTSSTLPIWGWDVWVRDVDCKLYDDLGVCYLLFLFYYFRYHSDQACVSNFVLTRGSLDLTWLSSHSSEYGFLLWRWLDQIIMIWHASTGTNIHFLSFSFTVYRLNLLTVGEVLLHLWTDTTITLDLVVEQAEEPTEVVQVAYLGGPNTEVCVPSHCHSIFSRNSISFIRLSGLWYKLQLLLVWHKLALNVVLCAAWS